LAWFEAQETLGVGERARISLYIATSKDITRGIPTVVWCRGFIGLSDVFHFGHELRPCWGVKGPSDNVGGTR
jgi:hypothetical protein